MPQIDIPQHQSHLQINEMQPIADSNRHNNMIRGLLQADQQNELAVDAFVESIVGSAQEL